MRRRPESRWNRTPGDVEELTVLQAELLDRAVALTRPGGVLTYITCSPHAAETRDQVIRLLERGEVELLDTVAWLTSARPTPSKYHPRQAASRGRRDVLCSCGTTGLAPILCLWRAYASVSICVMSATISPSILNCDIADLRGELTKIAGADVAHVRRHG